MKEDKHKINLIYPDEQAEMLLAEVDEYANRQEELNEVQHRRELVRDHIEWQFGMTESLYEGLRTRDSLNGEEPSRSRTSPDKDNFEGISEVQ